MRKHLVFVAFALTTSFSQAQIVDILDPNFKTALLKHIPKIDLNDNGEIEISEAEVVKNLRAYYNGQITDLTGIDFFTSLDTLHCANNKLTSLDVSKNRKLTILDCYNNQLTKLDVGENRLLKYLDCSTNLITSLDLSKNMQLEGLTCFLNSLTNLDLTTNTNLIRVWCMGNFNLQEVCLNSILDGKTTGFNWQKEQKTVWNFNCSITGIENEPLIPTRKEIIKIFTLSGQEIKSEQAIDGVFIYQYSDGSRKKIAKEN